MIWNIIADSSCDLKDFVIEDGDTKIIYKTVPFVISIDSKDYIDDDTINVSEMVDDMEKSKEACRSSCPSPASFEKEFREEGNVIAVTISKELSGSYNSAGVAKEMVLEDIKDKNIEIINSISAGAGLAVVVRNICSSILEGMSFDETVRTARRVSANKQTIFALCSFENLVKNGRMSKMAGFIASKLNFWGIGIGTSEGKIEIKSKVRGQKKAMNTIVEDIKEKGTQIKQVIISHCQNAELANFLKEEILKIFSDIKIEVLETKGLCSFYAEREGLIVSYL